MAKKSFLRRFYEKHIIAERSCPNECTVRETVVYHALDRYPDITDEIMNRLGEYPDDPDAPPQPEGGCKLNLMFPLCRHTPAQVHDLAAKILNEKKGGAK